MWFLHFSLFLVGNRQISLRCGSEFLVNYAKKFIVSLFPKTRGPRTRSTVWKTLQYRISRKAFLVHARRLVPADDKDWSAEDRLASCTRRDRYCSGAARLPCPHPTETFAISAELARTVRNAILLAGYESETADIKATETTPARFYNARVWNEYGVTEHCINSHCSVRV